jgi:hypothetical protein
MMLAEGVNVQPMVAPAVENDAARLRFFVAATHDAAQLRTAADALASVLARADSEFGAATPLPRARHASATPAALASPRSERAVVRGSLALAPEPGADD